MDAFWKLDRSNSLFHSVAQMCAVLGPRTKADKYRPHEEAGSHTAGYTRREEALHAGNVVVQKGT